MLAFAGPDTLVYFDELKYEGFVFLLQLFVMDCNFSNLIKLCLLRRYYTLQKSFKPTSKVLQNIVLEEISDEHEPGTTDECE